MPKTIERTVDLFSDTIRYEPFYMKGAAIGAATAGLATLVFCGYQATHAVPTILSGEGSALGKLATVGLGVPGLTAVLTYASAALGGVAGGIVGAGVQGASSVVDVAKTILHRNSA